MTIYLQAERRLAELRGWTNLVDAGNALIGTPPHGGVRGQAAVPCWTREWTACAPLIVELSIFPIDGTDHSTAYIWVFQNLRCLAQVKAAEHPDKEAAVRFAIVSAAIAALKMERQKVASE
jgi:hypothetical protein